LPTDFESDIIFLKEHLLEFSKLKNEFEFTEHPYIEKMDRKRWVNLAVYHLNHHLNQFDV